MDQGYSNSGSGPVFPVKGEDTYTLNGILYFRTAFLQKLGREHQRLPIVPTISLN
jgi:hypothetical protein